VAGATVPISATTTIGNDDMESEDMQEHVGGSWIPLHVPVRAVTATGDPC